MNYFKKLVVCSSVIILAISCNSPRSNYNDSDTAGRGTTNITDPIDSADSASSTATNSIDTIRVNKDTVNE